MQIPKAYKRQSSHQYLFVLWGSGRAKVAPGKLMKLTPGVNFTSILCAAFTRIYPKRAKKILTT